MRETSAVDGMRVNRSNFLDRLIVWCTFGWGSYQVAPKFLRDDTNTKVSQERLVGDGQKRDTVEHLAQKGLTNQFVDLLYEPVPCGVDADPLVRNITDNWSQRRPTDVRNHPSIRTLEVC